MSYRTTLRSAVVAVLLAATAGCDRNQGDRSDFSGMELTSALLAASPTNSVADDPAAAAFGKKLFFDRGLSSEGTVACANCHDATHGFSDPKPRSEGVRGQLGDRHAMPVTAAVLHPFLLWDGKADSAWLQPLKALENPKEMDFTRSEVAHYASTTYASEYETVFGPMPDLSAVPARALPGDGAWEKMPEALQNEVQRVFTNVGKSIEAYERQLLCTDTRFDRWKRGELELSDSELSGAGTFDREHCSRCHSGPSFSDGAFHNIGVPSHDRGRAVGAPVLLSDPLNGAGIYSDDPIAGQEKLTAIASETAQEGAFRTASLRGVGQRTFFGHAAHEETLRGFINDIYRRGRRGRNASVGVVDPKLDDVNVDDDDIDDLVTFLHTLDCPAPPAALRAP
jgi:cytochrome c peroxidase